METPLEIEKSSVDEGAKTILLGSVNPVNLTEEEFKGLDFKLYHGGDNKFEYSQDFDYTSEEYLNNHDGAQTLGQGIYLAAENTLAEKYSTNYRQTQGGENAQVHELVPYQANMLDLHNEQDPTKNYPVNKDFVIKWANKFVKYAQEKEYPNNFLGNTYKEIHSDYAKHLTKILERDSVDLRVMLSTAVDPNLKNRASGSPPWVGLFSEFMLENGIDGVIYNEGVDASKTDKGTSYVFYNLKKLGTYESWQNNKAAISTNS